MDEYDSYEEDGSSTFQDMTYYERKQYERQCSNIGEQNLMPLITGTEVADLFSGAQGLF